MHNFSEVDLHQYLPICLSEINLLLWTDEDFFMFDSQIEEEANNDDSAMIGLRRL